MNEDTFKGQWKQFKGEIQKKWGELTDDHLTEINGDRTKLIGKIQEAYGLARDEAERQVSDWEKVSTKRDAA